MPSLPDLIHEYCELLDQESHLERKKADLKAQIEQHMAVEGVGRKATPFGSVLKKSRFKLTPRPRAVAGLNRGRGSPPVRHFTPAKVTQILVPKYRRETSRRYSTWRRWNTSRSRPTNNSACNAPSFSVHEAPFRTGLSPAYGLPRNDQPAPHRPAAGRRHDLGRRPDRRRLPQLQRGAAARGLPRVHPQDAAARLHGGADALGRAHARRPRNELPGPAAPRRVRGLDRLDGCQPLSRHALRARPAAAPEPPEPGRFRAPRKQYHPHL